MSLSLVSPPATEPLTIDEAKAHLRLDSDDHEDDARISMLIEAAREMVEAHTGRGLITQTWALTLDDFPCGDQFAVPHAPLSSVTSIAYVDTAGDSQTWASSNYVVNAPAGPRARRGTITLDYDATWPTTRGQRDAVTVTYVAGYGAAASSVPSTIKSAMLLLIGEMWERREEAIAGTIIAVVPLSVSRLLASYVVGGL